jgi:hypothetical protein
VFGRHIVAPRLTEEAIVKNFLEIAMLNINARRAVRVASLLALLAPTTASASVLTELTLNSSPPADSVFAGGTMTGTIQLWTTDSASHIVPLGSPTQLPSTPANSEGILRWTTQAEYCWIDLAGLIGEGQTEFQMFAFPPNPNIPPGPPVAPPLVEIGMLNGASFEEATGPLVGFDGAQQVGTWKITEEVTPIPAALPLFATGLGGLGLLGWRRNRKAQAVA